ncbi:MAG: molybdopterin-dependent oxidoreductase [Pseudomonadota bacterium]
MSKPILGACPHDCPDTCSMSFNVADGVLKSVRGNSEHPYTRGRLCSKVNDYQNRVYHQDRVLHPLKRLGAKGSGRFRRITWDEALDEIACRWGDLIDDGRAEAILPYSYLGTQGIVNGLTVADPFFNKLGASVSERTFCDSGASTAVTMTMGHGRGLDPESFEHSKFIVLWACNSLSTNSHHWPFISAAKDNGATIVVIDPARTRTSALADIHLQIKPGTDLALAMGVMRVLRDRDLIDMDYVGNYTHGYERLENKFAAIDLDRVAAVTSIPKRAIEEFAIAYGSNRPAAIRIGVAIERHRHGGQAVRAIASLPALTGAWREVGGGLLQITLGAFPINWSRLSRADLIDGDRRVINQWLLGRALTGELGLDPPIQSLFVYNANPVAMVPEQQKVQQGLRRQDLFTVVSEHFITDTARYADIVLPATTQAEQEDIMFSWGHFYVTYNHRAIVPRGEAISNSELMRRLAAKFWPGDPYFTRSDEQQILEALDWDSPALSHSSLAELKAQGFIRLALEPPGSARPYAHGGFLTPTGKCELETTLAGNGDFVLPVFRQGYDGNQSGDPVDSVPDCSELLNETRSAEDLLQIISPKEHNFLNSSFANQRAQQKRAGKKQVLIHPNDAAKRDIQEGDRIKISNPTGHFIATATISEKTLEGVAIAPAGHWDVDDDGTVNAINAATFADLGRAPTFSSTLVAIAPIADEEVSLVDVA